MTNTRMKDFECVLCGLRYHSIEEKVAHIEGHDKEKEHMKKNSLSGRIGDMMKK